MYIKHSRTNSVWEMNNLYVIFFLRDNQKIKYIFFYDNTVRLSILQNATNLEEKHNFHKGYTKSAWFQVYIPERFLLI